jgi:hypothetical protein
MDRTGGDGRKLPAFVDAPRCGARNRAGHPCRAPAMRGKARCQMHGGKSTGPRTLAGRERAAKASLTHGYYTSEAIAERRRVREVITAIDALFADT